MNPEETNIKSNEYPSTPTRKPASPRVKKNRKKLLVGGAVAGAFLVGIVSGSASAGSAEPEVVEKEVIKEVEVPGPEVEVPVTPDACAAALDQAEENYNIYSEGLGIAGDMLGAAGSFDAAAMEQLNQDLDLVTADLEAGLMSYYVEATECRG